MTTLAGSLLFSKVVRLLAFDLDFGPAVIWLTESYRNRIIHTIFILNQIHDSTMGVQTLQNLAYNVSYEEIVRNSLLCDNHPQRGKPFPCLPFSSVLSSSRPPLSAQEKSNRVRIHLEYYLKGVVSDEIR